MRRAQRGTAMISVTVIVMALMGLGAALTILVLAQNRGTFSTASGMDAYYVAQNGLGHAVQELRAEQDLYANALVPASRAGTFVNATGACAGEFAGGEYVVNIVDPGDGTRVLTAVARKNGVKRAIEVRIRQMPPLPLAQAALAFYGDLDKKGKLDLHIKQKEADEDDEASSSTSSSAVAIDGHDQSGVQDLPGVGIEDPVTYARITEKIAKRLIDGKIPLDAIIGIPMTTIYDKKGDPATASFSLLENPTLDAALMGEIAANIENVVTTEMIPASDRTISGNNVKIKTPQTWGTSSSPEITVLDGTKMTMENGAAISGNGTLIVTGDVKMNNGSSLNWNGNVIVMGGNKDAIFKNNQGQVTINGNVMVLGTSSDKNHKSKFELHDDNGKNIATNTINGALMVITGDDTKHDEKAEVKIKHGDTTINGIVSVVGDKTKFDAHVHDEGSFTLNGSAALSVWGNDDKHKAKVHLHGEDILIHYHSANVNAAIEGLMELAGMLLPYTWTVVSWREVPPPTDVLP